MGEGEHRFHAERTAANGVELIMGEARFVGPRVIEVALNDGGTRRLEGERVFLDLGSRSTMPNTPGLADANPMTHIEALDLDRLPGHLVVIGGGYIGLELAQAIRRFGSQVTVVGQSPQPSPRGETQRCGAPPAFVYVAGVEVLLAPPFSPAAR